MDPSVLYYTTFLAATYNCNAYGAGNYNEAGQCTTGTATGGSSAGGLVDTGSPVFYTLAAGILLVVVALSVIVYKIVRHKQAAK